MERYQQMIVGAKREIERLLGEIEGLGEVVRDGIVGMPTRMSPVQRAVSTNFHVERYAILANRLQQQTRQWATLVTVLRDLGAEGENDA